MWVAEGRHSRQRKLQDKDLSAFKNGRETNVSGLQLEKEA